MDNLDAKKADAVLSQLKTERQIRNHLTEGWTLDKLIAVFEEDGTDYSYHDDLVESAKAFVAEGNPAGNFFFPERMNCLDTDPWGRRDHRFESVDPVGFGFDFNLIANHRIVLEKYKPPSSKDYEFNLWVLGQVWKPIYKEAYLSLGYLDGCTTFLDTKYWNTIREYLIFSKNYSCESNQCQMQYRSGNMYGQNALEIHHKAYRYHGEEHLHVESLCVLHSLCHQACHPKGLDAKSYYW